MTQTTDARYPAAERLARTARLPLAADPVARELYGVAAPVLDVAAARDLLAGADLRRGTPAWDVAWAILEQRAAAVAARP